MRPRSVAVCVTMVSASVQMMGADSWWAWKRFSAALDARCASKNLHLLPYAELPDVIDTFSKRLSAREKKRVETAVADRCNEVQMGASCGNEAFLRVMIERNRLDEFAEFVCALPKRCTAQSACEEIQ